MGNFVGRIEPGDSAPADGLPVGGGDLYGEFTGVAGWVNKPWVFGTALGAIALVYLASITPNWYPTPDSALYLMLGDNLADGAGYTLWGKPHVHVPPGFPLLLAGLKLVGIDTILGRNLVMMLLAWGALAFSYLALREMISATLAKWILLLVAVSHVMHHTSVCLLSDVPFMFLIWLGIWCQLRGLRTGSWTLELGTALLLASGLLRVVGVLVAVGAALGLLFQLQQPRVSRRRIWLNVVLPPCMMMLVVGCAAVYVFDLSRTQSLPSYFNELSTFVDKASPSGLLQPVMNLVQTATELSTLLTGQKNKALGAFIAMLWFPVLTGAIVSWKQGNRYGVCIAAIYLVTLIIVRPLVARYLLPLSPLLFWFTIEGLRWLSDRELAWKSRGLRLALTCILVLLLLNIPKAAKLAYRLHYPKTDNAYKEQMEMVDVASFLKSRTDRGKTFVTTQHERELSYLSGVWSIPQARQKLVYQPPTAETLDEVLEPSVEYLVVRNFGSRRHLRRFHRALAKFPGIKKVHENGQFQVFRTHGEPHQMQTASTVTNGKCQGTAPAW